MKHPYTCFLIEIEIPFSEQFLINRSACELWTADALVKSLVFPGEWAMPLFLEQI